MPVVRTLNNYINDGETSDIKGSSIVPCTIGTHDNYVVYMEKGTIVS